MTEPVIRAAHATLGYEGIPVVQSLEFEIPAGSRVGILGPNGGGKTTLFRALTGEIPPLSGQLEVNATSATVAQTDRSRLDFPVSALDVATMGSLARLPWWKRPGRAERRRARQALEEVGLEDLANHTFGDLSGAGVAYKLAWRLATLHCRSPRVTEDFRALLVELLVDMAPEHRAYLRMALQHGEQGVRIAQADRLHPAAADGHRVVVEAHQVMAFRSFAQRALQ